MRRSWSAVNFVGRVKSTARMRAAALLRGAAPRGAAPRWPPRRARRSRRRSGLAAAAHAATLTSARCPASSSVSLPPASRTVTRASSTSTRIVRPRLPPVAVGDDRDAQCLRAARARRPRCAGRPRGRRTPSANMLAPPTSTASRRELRGAERSSCGDAAPARRGRRTCASLSGRGPATRQHDVGEPGDAAARSTSASPMHEPRPSETSTWPGARDTASSPMRTMVSDRGHQPRPRRASSSSTPPWSGTSRNEIEQSSPSTTRSESSTARRRSAPARRPARVATIAPSMSVAVCGGVGLDAPGRSSRRAR